MWISFPNKNGYYKLILMIINYFNLLFNLICACANWKVVWERGLIGYTRGKTRWRKERVKVCPVKLRKKSHLKPSQWREKGKEKKWKIWKLQTDQNDRVFLPQNLKRWWYLTLFSLPRVLFTEWTFSTLMKAFFDNGFNPFNCRMERWSPEKYLCHHIGTLLSRKTGWKSLHQSWNI